MTAGLGLLAAGLGFFADALSLLDRFGPRSPEVLSGDVSVAVYGLGRDAGRDEPPAIVGERIDDVEAGLAQHVSERLARFGAEGLEVDTAGPDPDDLSSADPGLREEEMRDRAERLRADYVLSGTVTTAGGTTVVRPELYIASGAVPQAGELTGFHRLGAIDLGGDLSNPLVAAELRARLLDGLDPVIELAIGLAQDAMGAREKAARHLAAAESAWDEALDPQLLHLAAGNLAGKRGELAEAERRYRLADTDEGSGRARFGLAEVVFQRARCGTPSVDAAALREAEQRYRDAGAADHPPEARLEERIAFGLGRVYVCLGQARIEQRWSEADRELSKVTDAFEAEPSGLRELASEAYALRSIVALPTPTDRAPEQRLRQAEDHARAAVEHAVDPVRRGVHLGQLGYVLSELGEPEAARDAYLEALELDPAHEERYRKGIAALDFPAD